MEKIIKREHLIPGATIYKPGRPGFYRTVKMLQADVVYYDDQGHRDGSCTVHSFLLWANRDVTK